MENLTFRRRELDFMLHEFLPLTQLCQQPRYADHDRETLDATLDTALRVADETFANHAAKLDANEPTFDGKNVHIIPEVKAGLEAFISAGLMGASFDFEDGGSQLPYTVSQAVSWIFTSANIGTIAYPFLTMAAANLLKAHGTPEQREQFMKPMIEGQFFGTMCLSEPQAGSSLGDIRTQATATADGHYLIRGKKMWISGGEHALSDNIVHLVLAKIPGSPAGSRGISLFLVPKYRLDADGKPGESNNIALAGLNHKMGYRGTVNTLLNFGEGGETHGWLVGEANKGLACMFHMMNEARIGVGLNAAVLGHQGYLYSLDYARNRPQGRHATNRDPNTPQLMISEHADVKRMLLQQKVFSEGAIALCLYGASLVDELYCGPDAQRHKELDLELAILTPIIKAWPSHFCLEANYWGQQILGGYGYTREYPLERIYRDNRLNPIHEGTNGIQSLDLLGRKVTMGGGAAFKLLLGRMLETAAAADGVEGLNEFSTALRAACDTVGKTTGALGAVAMQGNTDQFLANSWVYLEMLGHTVIAWMWLKQALVAKTAQAQSQDDADFYAGKLHACRYFYRWELPKITRQAELLSSMEDSLLSMPPAGF